MCNLISAWATMFFFSGLATFMAKFYQVIFNREPRSRGTTIHFLSVFTWFF